MTTREQQHYRRQTVSFKQDDDSDAEESKSDGRELQIIHSGHFMVSSLHIEHPPKKGYDFDTVNKKTCQTYHFGKASTSHLSIDASLTKLFECMTLAYSGKLVSPKWKNFKGLKLLWRDKIRLNNAIWRAWYMQYVEKRENPVCHFVTPLDGSLDNEDQRRPEAIAMEGKYWKRGIEIVREYHKWRTYFKKRLQNHKNEDLSSLLKGGDEQFSLFGEICPDALQNKETGAWHSGHVNPESPVPMEMDSLFDIEMLMSEISDTLFSTLSSHQPMAWPNPREIAHAGNADMIQPGLINLQPNLDFMGTVDPLQDLFHSFRQPALPSTSSCASDTSSHTQASVLPPVIETAELPSICVTNQSGGNRTITAYTEDYMPLFSGPPDPVPAPVTTVPPAPLPPPPAPLPGQRSALDKSSPASFVMKPSSSKARPSTVGANVSRRSTFTPPRVPPKAVAQPQPPTASLPPPPAFAQPKPSQSVGVSSRMRHVQSIAPASPLPPPPLFLTGPFSGHSGTVIITPNPLQEVVPPSNVVITPPDIGKISCGNHISAEQKRRFNINIGFKTLCGLVPTLKTKSSSKPISNAATLQKTVEYISKLQQERHQMQEEARRLREEIEELNASINSCHQKLPATGVPITRHRFDYMWDKFNEYVRSRTLQNWKFWIFSIIIKPLFESFNSMVSTSSVEELRQTTLRWLDRHCALPVLRPMVLDSLRQFSTSSSILTDPSLLPEEATQAVTRIHKHTGKS
ncbi:MLX-interacting protein-like [Megalops cyprinoides]|uniref:MLX-interacting protein-like n=1 Tax=Megalops cyprinoides TaxID=118141 RepID=UPI001865480E|nr:MLX-interacting protein-like [Megalops cyprinoides]